MKAFVYQEYGSPDVLELQEVEQPTLNENRVLVKIHAASVNAGDRHMMRGQPLPVRFLFGLFKPKVRVLGSDIAGRVEAVGKNVRTFKPGDDVFGNLSACGFGGFAEYASVPESALMSKPPAMTFEEAAAVPLAGLTALQGLRDEGGIKPGQTVLINGASGGVGTFAVQLAKVFGAEVTGVCSTGNLDLVRSIGADHVIDYTRENFTRNGRRYDLILAVSGNHSILEYRRALNREGRYVMIGGALSQFFQAAFLGPVLSLSGRKKMSGMLLKSTPENQLLMKRLLEEGRVKPVVERRYAFRELPEALRHMETGRARGKVVVSLEHRKENSPPNREESI